MDIADKLPDDIKREAANTMVEMQVLQKLLAEKKFHMEEIGNRALGTVGLSPKTHQLEITPSKNIWNAVLKPNVLTIPGQDIVNNIVNRKHNN